MKILDMLKNKIKYNKKTMLFLVIIVIIGILTGSFFSVILNQNDKQLVIDNITNYIENINKINNLEILKNTFIVNILVIFGIWILGISVIGLFIVIILLFWKSFTLSFTVSSFILTYNLKGLLLSFIYIFPHLIINMLIYLYIGSYALKFSILIIKCIFHKINLDLRKLMIIYLKVLIISLIIIIISSLYESFIMPFFLKYLVPLIIK